MGVREPRRSLDWQGVARAAAGAGLTLALGGCSTHLSTQPDWKVTNGETALTGIPYSLPMLQHEVTLTRAISGCPQPMVITNDLLGPAESLDKKPLTIMSGRLAMTMKVEAKERYVPGERYLIDYEPLKAPFATSALAIAVYPSGILKSLNASADDQTAQVIQAGVKFGFSVAKLTAGVPTPDLIQPLTQSDTGEEPDKKRDALRKASLEKLKTTLKALPKTRYVACNPETTIWAAQADKNTSDQEEKTKLLNSANADVTRASAVAALRNAQPKHLDALDGALAQQATFTTALADLVDTRKKIDGRLGASVSFVWPRRFDSRSQDLPATNETAKKFVEMLMIRDEPVVTAKVIADWIDEVRKKDPVLADEFAAHEWFSGFLRVDGTAVAEKKALKGCADDPSDGPASEAACIDNYLNARIGLRLADSELGACGDAPPSSKACRALVSAVDEGGDIQPTPANTPAHRSPPAPAPRPSAFPPGRYARDGRSDPGVFVRSPAQGVLQVCRSAGPALAADAVAPGETATDFTPCGGQLTAYTSKPAILAPQLGQLRYLPVRNGAFEASELSLALREDGAMETFGYKKTRAALPGALGAANDAADQYRAYKEGRDTARATALKTGREQQLAALQYQIDTLTKSKELLKAQAPTPPEAVDALKDIKAQTAALEAEIALLKAEKSKIEATAALAALATPAS